MCPWMNLPEAKEQKLYRATSPSFEHYRFFTVSLING